MKRKNLTYQACLTIGSICVAGSGHAALLASDDFDGFADGTGLQDVVNTGTGWDAAWEQQGGTDDYVIASSSPLTYAGVTNSTSYADHLMGNNNAGRQFDLSGTFTGFQSSPSGNIDSGVLYLSALLRIDDNTDVVQDTSYLALSDNTTRAWRDEGSGSTQYVRIGSFDGGNWSLEIEGLPLIDSGVAIEVGRTDLLVLKIDQNTDTFSLFVNPTTNDEPLLADATGVFAGYNGFASLGWEGGRSSLDRIRVADSFADAVVVPEPASVSLFAAGVACVLGRRRRS